MPKFHPSHPTDFHMTSITKAHIAQAQNLIQTYENLQSLSVMRNLSLIQQHVDSSCDLWELLVNCPAFASDPTNHALINRLERACDFFIDLKRTVSLENHDERIAQMWADSDCAK